MDEQGAPSGDRPRPPHIESSSTSGKEYANHVEVIDSAGLIHLVFGVEEARQTPEVDCQARRIVGSIALSRAVAEDLLRKLSSVLHHQRASGSSPDPDMRISQASSSPHDNNMGSASAVKSTSQILTLLRSMAPLQAPLDLEQSFKLSNGSVYEDRLLLGVKRDQETTHLDRSVADVLERIDMPTMLRRGFLRDLERANHVYFGVEKADDSVLFKTYLEFRDRAERLMENHVQGQQSYLLFTGYKWDTSKPERQAVTSYHWYPQISSTEVRRRISSYSSPIGLTKVHAAIVDMVSNSIANLDPHEFQFLEVEEQGSSRHSFDINLYRTEMVIRDILPQLLKILEIYRIPASRVERLYNRIKKERLGHIAAGTDRRNQDFLTVYYGARKVHSDQLASARLAIPEEPDR